MRIRKRKKKGIHEKNFILIILGLLLIFIIGYVFWQKSQKKKKHIEEKEEESNTLIELKLMLNDFEKNLSIKEIQLENKVARRNILFFYTRLSLVILMILVYLLLQFIWIPELYSESHWFDNLRNFITATILGFTTIAFIAKGNLKSFKESIEGMAINWFFNDEANIKTEIILLNDWIYHINVRITQLELEKSIVEHQKEIVGDVAIRTIEVRNEKR